MSASAVAEGNSNIAHTYWLEQTPAPAPAPAPSSFSYQTYQYAPVPMAGSQWDYGTLWLADARWVEPWPAYEAV
eukprot:11226827-Lingulodinium_polyedra.AAC.1